MTTEELQTIFTKLDQQTQRKQLKWKPFKNDVLRMDFPRSSIIFYRNPGGIPSLSILNSGGSSVAEISHGSFSSPPQTAHQLRAMWKAAYEIAFETDETVKDILSKLGDG
jgi:hypothetical protein